MSQGTAIHPIYAIVGDERFLVTGALEHLLQAMSEELDALGPAEFDGTRATLAEVLDELRTPSLLGSRRAVILDDADAFITEHRAALERYAADPSPTGTLILICRTFPRNTRLHKAVEAKGRVFKIEAPKGRALAPWVVTRARDFHGKRVAPACAEQLVEHVGDSPGALDAELAKLATYVGSRLEILPGDVAALTGRHREEKVFAVMDAMASGDVASALRHWEQVLATDRAAPGRAVAGLAWSVRRLLEARRELDRGASVQALSRKMFTEPALLHRRLQCHTASQLEVQQHELLEADLAVKTGSSTVELAVEKFIVRHAGSARETVGARRGAAWAV
jgi:DNA polymerase-3 subunit delta